MNEESAVEFFTEKREWSKYKDLILDYYLKPYLAKVLTVGKKVVIVDCCAGPGKFDDGELGSPLIIANTLSEYYQKGANVYGYFIEHNSTLFARLERNLSSIKAPHDVQHDNFKNCINDIAEISKTCTVFLYIDPFKPSCLYFDELKDVYDNLRDGSSVETLINFMSTSFCRGIFGPQKQSIDEGLLRSTPQIEKWNSIAGGEYWQQYVLDHKLSMAEKVERIASGYSDQLNKWFQWSLFCPIKQKYEHELPKYHLIFGSRSHHAVDLMNRAMVKARREFVGAISKGCLFDMTPDKEIIDESEIRELIVETLKDVGKSEWYLLRANATVRTPGLYTDSEINKAIKSAITNGHIKSNCGGTRIEDNSLLST